MTPDDPNLSPANSNHLTHSSKNVIEPLTDLSEQSTSETPASQPLQPTILASTPASPAPDNLPSTEYSPPTPTVPTTSNSIEQPITVLPSNLEPPVVTNPEIVVGGGGNQNTVQPFNEKPAKNNPKIRRLIYAFSGLLVVAGLAAGFYFGYYMNPNTIWSESQSDNNIAYSRLINYVNSAPQISTKGASLTGTFNLTSGSLHASGSMVGKSYNQDNTTSLKIDDGVANLDLEEKAITASGSSAPDYYVQINGIKGIDAALGGGLGASVDSLDNQWIEVDHNLIADIKQKMFQQKSDSKLTMTKQEIFSTLESIGKVNKQYLFSTDSTHAVTRIVKKDGFQTLNNQRTYQYTIGFNKENTKTYLNALCSAVKSSPLGSYIAANSQQPVNQLFNCPAFANQADKLKASDNFEVWVNVNQRLIQQVEINNPSDPAGNYVALGYDYKGGDTFPFYIKGLTTSHADNGNYTVNALINTKTSTASINFNAHFSNHNSPTNLSGNFQIAPNNKPLNLTVPASVLQINQVLAKIGLGTNLQQLLDASSPSTAVQSPAPTALRPSSSHL